MRRATIAAGIAVLLIAVGNYFYYRNLYRTQTVFITSLLDRQVQAIGREVDEFNFYFTSDLSKDRKSVV